MNSPQHATNESRTPAIDWMRKRDGEVVRFDIDKLAQSLRRAARDTRRELPEQAAAELAHMTTFFIRSHMTGHVLASDEAAEWIETSLRETGQLELAESYAAHSARKRQLRQAIVAESSDPSAGDATSWDKSHIARSLRIRLNLDSRRSREVASQVERIVLRGGFGRLSTDLIREIVNAELEGWGLPGRLQPSRQLSIGMSELKRELAAGPRPNLAGHRLAGRIWRHFSLHEVVSRDVADAERRGVISIQGLESPTGLAASCIDCGQLVRQAIGSRESISRFGAQLARAVDLAPAILAIERLEPWLALVAEPKDSPAALAASCWMELQSRLRHSPIQCVLNLYGGLPPSGTLEMGAGPLYSQQPLSAEREFAGAVAQEILGLFQRDGGDWPQLRVDWHWYSAPDPVQTALVQRIMRVIVEGSNTAIVFDRGPVPLAEGMRRLGDSIRPVLDFIGIGLPRVWRDAGSPRSLSAVEDGLRQAVQCAVRAGIQKREFLRQFHAAADPSLADTAVLAIFPIGLDWTVAQLAGKGFAEEEGALRLAETLVRYLREAAEREARHFALGVTVDHPAQRPLHAIRDSSATDRDEPLSTWGLNPADPSTGLRRRIHAAARLHAVAQAGTLDCPRTLTPRDQAERLAETLDWTCRNTELVRLRWVPDPRDSTTQGVVDWPDP